jgi:hypothetical protein
MTRTTLACVMAVLAVAGEAAAAEQLPRIDAQAPRSIRFADDFDYVVVATVPAATAATARLTADVGPFSVMESTPLERTRRGDAVVLRLARRLTCVQEGCLGNDRTARAVIPGPLLESASGAVRGRPTVVAVEGRVPPFSLPRPTPFPGPRPMRDPFRADTAVPPLDGRSPTTAMTALAAVALLSLVSAVALVAVAIRQRRRADVDELARAVRLVRESAGRPEPDRRRAADLLARVAGARDRDGLAAEARRTAWAPPDPTVDAVEALAAHAAREGG